MIGGVITEQDYMDLSKDFSKEKDRLEKLVADTRERLDVELSVFELSPTAHSQ